MPAKLSFVEAVDNFMKFLMLDRRDILDVLIYALMASVLSLSLPLGIQAIIGFFMAASFSASIVLLIALIVLGTMFYGIMQLRQIQILEKIKQKIFYKFAMSYIHHIPDIDISESHYHLPEIANRFMDTSTIQKSYQKLLLELPLSILQILFGLILLSFYHAFFIGFGILMLVSLYILFRYTASAGYRSGTMASDYKYRILAWIQEMASMINTLKFSGKTLAINTQNDLLNHYMTHRNQHFRVLQFQYISLIAFKVIVTSLMLIIGSFLLIEQEINVGQFIAADIVILAIMTSVEKLITNISTFYDSIIALQKVQKLLNLKSEATGSLDMSVIESIEFMNFEIEKNSRIILNIPNFKISRNQIGLIYGDTGSGKSLMIKSMLKIFNQYRGIIKYNAQPINLINIEQLRSKVSIMLEGDILFSTTILDNITFGQPYDSDLLDQLLILLELNDYVSKLPEGLYTRVDFLGGSLPKWVKTRIKIARTLIKDADLYILENACMYLSPHQIDQVINIIKTKGKMGIFTNTHNIETVNFDYKLDLNLY